MTICEATAGSSRLPQTLANTGNQLLGGNPRISAALKIAPSLLADCGGAGKVRFLQNLDHAPVGRRILDDKLGALISRHHKRATRAAKFLELLIAEREIP